MLGSSKGHERAWAGRAHLGKQGGGVVLQAEVLQLLRQELLLLLRQRTRRRRQERRLTLAPASRAFNILIPSHSPSHSGSNLHIIAHFHSDQKDLISQSKVAVSLQGLLLLGRRCRSICERDTPGRGQDQSRGRAGARARAPAPAGRPAGRRRRRGRATSRRCRRPPTHSATPGSTPPTAAVPDKTSTMPSLKLMAGRPRLQQSTGCH